MSDAGKAAAPRAAAAAAPAATRPPNRVEVDWQGGHRFSAGTPGGARQEIDADGKTAPGPVNTLLASLAACASTDVVDILAKRRTPVTALHIEVVGTRVETTPRRLTHVLLRFRLSGEGIDQANAERAVGLSIEKYCSVRSSLDRDITIEWEVVLA